MKISIALVFYLIISVSNAQSLKEKADKFYAFGNYTKAIETYKSVKNLDEVYDEIAKAYVAIGNYGEGLVNYKKAIEANPNNTLLKYEYAKLLSRTKNYEDANSLFKTLIQADSLNPNYHYELGVVLEKQKDTLAINEFLKTFNLDLTHQKAIFKLAKHLIVKRKFKESHRFLDKGLESYANNVELISLKAQAYYYQDFFTHSVVWFKKLLDLGEASEFIHEKLSLSYAQNSDYEDAIYHRKQALRYNPYDSNAMFVIGGYYERLSDFEMAEEFYNKSLTLQDVSLSNEFQKLGRVLNRQKKYDQAIRAFQKSLKEDPSNIMSEFFIVRTKDEFYADIDTKIKLYENFIEKHKKNPYARFAEARLKELKEEKFLEQD